MKKFIILLSLVLFLETGAHALEKKKTICLNMIVKNETKVIKRCLESVKPIIDYWVIVDTGSTDGTQKMVRDFMKGIPGELYEKPFVNFEVSRNHALSLTKNKGDYVLIMDADDELVFSKDFKKPLLDKDFYYVTNEHESGTSYQRNLLLNNHLSWKWYGVLHEYIFCKEAKTSDTLQGVTYKIHHEGARSQDPQKFQKDAQVFENALKDDPNNSRYVFYLAQSYRDARDYTASIKNYEKRISMKGWDQEVFWSMYQIGVLQETMKVNPEIFTHSYFQAYAFRPTRAEPLYRLANYYRTVGKYSEGLAIASLGLTISLPQDNLFVEKWVYDYGLLLEYSLCCYWLGKYLDAKAASHKILTNKSLPPYMRERVEKNLKEWIDPKLQKEIETVVQKK